MGARVHSAANYGLEQEPFDEECRFDGCSTRRSDRIAAPVCDRHAILVYRQMHELISTTGGAARPHATAKFTPGHVYFIRQGGLIKIGFSNDVTRRKQTLGGGEVLAVIPGDQYTEKDLHRQFRHLRAHGEWFRPERDLLDYIDSLKAA